MCTRTPSSGTLAKHLLVAGESRHNLFLRRTQMGPGVAWEGWNTRKLGYLWGKICIFRVQPPPSLSPGLAHVAESRLVGQEGEAGGWAGGPA